jgi:hypothetical protein
MWIRFTLLFALLFTSLLRAADPCFVFVHIGPKVPPYAEHALLQARLFNPDCPIYFIGNQAALKDFSIRDPQANITFISCESLPKTSFHTRFLAKTQLQTGFWRFASERFLYVQDLMKHFHLKNVFHLENDVLIYTDARKLLPVLKSNYQGIAAPFNNDQQCIPGLVFIPHLSAMEQLAQCFADLAGTERPAGAFGKDWNDMEILSFMYRFKGSKYLDMLPTTTAEYAQENPLADKKGTFPRHPTSYYKRAALFGGVFDAAALGQFLGGVDPIHDPNSTSFLNTECVFDASRFSYFWEEDSQGRKIPYLVYKNQKTPIFNIHFHCKRLHLFTSKPF